MDLGSLSSWLFLIVGVVLVASSILVISMRNPVHSALFLLLTFLSVAILFVGAHAEFVGAVQLLVYAGGIMVLFLFVVMLVDVRQLPGARILSPYWKAGVGVGLALFLVFGTIFWQGAWAPPAPNTDALRQVAATPAAPAGEGIVGNSEAIGMSLYREYLVPFEVASLFLLVAMIGAIVIGKRQLLAMEEETQPRFILEKVAEEQKEKEAIGA